MFNMLAVIFLLAASAAATDPFRAWTGPFLNPEVDCGPFKATEKDKFAYVIPFISEASPQNGTRELLMGMAAKLKETTTVGADVIALLPSVQSEDAAALASQATFIKIFKVDDPLANLGPNPFQPQIVNGTTVTFNSKYLLNVWGLDQMNYTRVIVLDPRGLVTNTSTLDQLFFCKSKFIYTAMPMGPLYSGMLALTPSSAALADMLRRIGQAASFDPDRGWFGQGYPCRTTRAYNISYSLRRDYESCFTDSRGGIMRERWMRYEYSSVAGFLWAYFNFVEGAGVDVVDTCLYSYHFGFNCNVKNFGASAFVLQSNVTNPVPYPGHWAVRLLSNGHTHVRRPEPVRCRPSYFILGVRKGGSTDLYVRLARHPNVVRNSAWYLGHKDPIMQARTGETFVFNRLNSKPNRIDHKDAVILNKRFSALKPGEVTGDSSVGYFTNPDVPVAMLLTCPISAAKFKFLLLVREPIDRLHSQYLMRVRLQTDGLNNETRATEYLGDELKTMNHRIRKAKKGWLQKGEALFRGGPANVLYDGLYVLHLNRWLKYFLKDQIMLICSEDIWNRSKRAALLTKAQLHIGLTPHPNVVKESEAANSKGDTRYGDHHSLDKNSTLYKELVEFYRPYNRMLREQWNLDCPWMKDFA